jgi:hypothetical protein
MALKLQIASLDDVHEDLQDAYVDDGKGGFELDYSAIKEHPGVRKVRKTADDLDRRRKDSDKTLAELQEKFGDLDPETARAALKAVSEMDDKKLIEEGDIDEVVNKRVENALADFNTKLAAKDELIEKLSADIGTRDTELSSIKIYDAIKDSALSKGARKDALQDISNRAKAVWSLQDGKPTAMDDDGNSIMGAKAEALTIDEWIDGLAKESSYLFESNTGGGAGGDDNTNSQNITGIKNITPSQSGDFLQDIADGKAVIDH